MREAAGGHKEQNNLLPPQKKGKKNVFTLHLVVCKAHNSDGGGDPRAEFLERSLSLVGAAPVIDESGTQKIKAGLLHALPAGHVSVAHSEKAQ